MLGGHGDPPLRPGCYRPSGTGRAQFILIGLGNTVSGGWARARFVGLARSLRADPNTIIVPASEGLVAAGFRLFAEREDKDWSLTDCISFVVMRERGIAEALTADHHFEQAAFRILLGQVP